MTFAHLHCLWLLLVVPPAMLVFFWWSWRTRRTLMTHFIRARLLPGLTAGLSVTRQKIRAACLMLAVSCLIFALAQPQWGYELEEVTQSGLDIIVAIDTSKSMLAEDIAPNRLARAKLAALDLMQQARSDRLGLVAFAGTAFLQCPLTVDDAVFRQSVEALDVNTIPEGGTAVAGAIAAAQNAFKEGNNYQVLVLFTDGEDHESGALEAAKKAAKGGLRIFTIGIGSVDGGLLRIKRADGQADYVRDEDGNVVKSHLNEALLQEIAGAANGFYLPLRGADTIDTLYQKGLAPLPKSQSQEKWMKRAKERYHWPLALAMVLVVVEMFLPERWSVRNARPRPGQLPGEQESDRPASGDPGIRGAPAPVESKPEFARRSVAAILVLAFLPASMFASPSSALREYQSGNYDQALKDYEQSLQKQGDDLRLHFNAGAAAYRNRQFEQAAKHFDQALASSDLKLQEQAYYNLGNTLYRLGERNPDPSGKSEAWQASLKQFENSLKLDSQDADAKFNHEFVKKKLEELQQQQQQQQKQNQQQQQQSEQKSQPNQSPQDQKQQPQNQQNESSKKDQPPGSKPPSQPDQKPDASRPQPEQKQSQPKPQEQPRPDQSPEAKDQNQPQPNENRESAQAGAAGQMTPQEAQQLLDSQKNDEWMLPVSRKQAASNPERPVKDW